MARILATLHAQASYLAQPLLAQMQMAIIVIGAMFYIDASLQGEAFSQETFGAFALLFPAEAWASVMMGGSAMVWIGLRDPVKRWMVAVGAALQTVQYLALGFSAIHTGGELVIGLHCTIFFAPIFAVTFWRACFEHS